MRMEELKKNLEIVHAEIQGMTSRAFSHETNHWLNFDISDRKFYHEFKHSSNFKNWMTNSPIIYINFLLRKKSNLLCRINQERMKNF